MTKIPKSNYTQIPNVYFDEIMGKLNGSENLVLMAIMRKTFGWHKDFDRISYSQIIDATGLSRGTVATTIKSLEEKELIKIIKKGQNNLYTVNVQEDSLENELVQNLDQSNICTSTSLNFIPDSDETSLNFRHTKETNLNKLSKENNTQHYIPNLSSKLITNDNPVSKPKKPKQEKPEGVSQEIWEEYISLRKQKRAPVTNTVIKGLEREADKAGMSLEEAMRTCIERGWQGFNAEWVDGKQSHQKKAWVIDEDGRIL